MDIKRKCATDANEAGTSANKRCKPSTNDDEIDPNSLVGMPDDILDEISNLLDLADCKSLSETCKKFNGYFSQVRNLKKLWLNTIKAGPKLTEQTMEMSSRRLTHRNVICDLSNPKKIEKIVQYFSPSSDNTKSQISSLQIRKHVDVMAMATHLLPRFFGNLTHLEFTSITGISWGQGITELNSKLNFDRVAMPHLEFLEIYCKLFAFLDRHYIDFSTEKLHTIKVSDDNEFRHISTRYNISDDDNLDIDNRIRALIAKQKNLKILFLRINNADFFDRQLIVQSKLKTFELEAYYWKDLDSEQKKKNFFVDLIESQTELECVNVDAYMDLSLDGSDNQRLRICQQNRLNQRIKLVRMSWHSHALLPNNNSLLLSSTLAGEPNLAVHKLELTIHNYSPGETSRYLAATATKFPKIHMMLLHVFGYSTSYDFSMLSQLEELSELHYFSDIYQGLETITLPKLRCIGFRYPHDINVDFETRVENLQQFLVRHSKIREIQIALTQQQHLINWLEFALTHLKHLELIVLINNEIQLTQYRYKKMSSLIAAHAKPGFRIIANKIKFMKRLDGKVVREKGGSWTIYE